MQKFTWWIRHWIFNHVSKGPLFFSDHLTRWSLGDAKGRLKPQNANLGSKLQEGSNMGHRFPFHPSVSPTQEESTHFVSHLLGKLGGKYQLCMSFVREIGEFYSMNETENVCVVFSVFLRTHKHELYTKANYSPFAEINVPLTIEPISVESIFSKLHSFPFWSSQNYESQHTHFSCKKVLGEVYEHWKKKKSIT